MSSSPAPPKLSQDYMDAFIGDRLTNTAIAFLVLDTAFVALRYWSRYLQKASFGWDDILIIPAYVSCLGICICGILLVEYGGVGRHIDAIVQSAPEKIVFWGRCALIATTLLSAVSSTLPKLVVLALYLRIFTKAWSRVGCYIIGAVLIAACITNMILIVWQCSPPDYVWNKTIAHGHCRDDLQKHIRWGLPPNIITDVAMLILPLPMIWKLRTSTKLKIGLTATFVTGSVPLSKLRSWTEDHRNLSRDPKKSTEFELQTAQKHAYTVFNNLDDDLEGLTTSPRSEGNHTQAVGLRDKHTLRLHADEDRIHVQQEVTLESA